MMTQRTLLALLPAVLLLGLSALLSGCARHTTTTEAPAQNAAQAGAAQNGMSAAVARQFKAIDDNPNMPPQAKEAAKASILQGQNVRPVVK
jgi:hypothetical protein